MLWRSHLLDSGDVRDVLGHLHIMCPGWLSAMLLKTVTPPRPRALD